MAAFYRLPTACHELFMKKSESIMVKEIDILKDEWWYCGVVNDGYKFPLTASDCYKIDLNYNDTYNQINPIFLSSKGRYIWLAQGGVIEFLKGKILITADAIEFDGTIKTLKEAQQIAAKKYFPGDKKPIDESLFEKVQLCTWISLKTNQNQKDVLKYVEEFLQSGFKASSVIIDDTWQADYGDWDFNEARFPSPVEMCEKIHNAGLKIIMWIVPYVSFNCKNINRLKEEDCLLRDEHGDYVIAKWFDGESFVLNFNKESTQRYIDETVEYLKEKYQIDGFKLDCGDAHFLPKDFKNANGQNIGWLKAFYPNGGITEARCSFQCAGESRVQRLADKAHIWGVEMAYTEEDGEFLRYGLSSMLGDFLTLGVSGYYFGCADMVGGGLLPTMDEGDPLDSELLIRWCQAAALLPITQFSYAYWQDKDSNVRDSFKECLTLREQFVDYIKELANIAREYDTPIVRYMEYEFPNCGMEKVTSQFMLGDKYIVAPVLEKGATTKEVVFPKNTEWKDFYNGQIYKQGVCVVDAPLNKLPIFERVK